MASWVLRVIVCVLLMGAPALAASPTEGMGRDEITALQRRLIDAKCYAGPADGTASEALAKAIAACPSQAPQPRIETGMHAAAIERIGVDADCRIAATGSDDKTVRVWSLPEGQLLRTLRVPIGGGNEGKIYATAVSPEGRWIAAGGWDARYPITRDNAVTIFDASSGAVVARVDGFGNVINHLVFSADGRWLAATSTTGVGVKVIDTSTWRVVASDADYGGDSYGAAFGLDGRLYTVADDRKLRRYGPGPRFAKQREGPTRGTKPPFSVSVDPGGTLLAIGFYETAKVEVYTASTLALRFAADTRDADNGDLFSVAWRGDGKRLAAGGHYTDGAGKRSILMFDQAGHRVGAPLPIAGNTILNIQPCADGFAVAAADPAFGLVEHDGRIGSWTRGVAPDARDKLAEAFTLSTDARQVRFGLGFGISEAVRFDSTVGTVIDAPSPIQGFIMPKRRGLPIADWEDSYSPTFAGKSIKLEENETSRSLAIRSDRAGFVLGTEYSLRAYDAKGQPVWPEPKAIPGAAWGVNLSADGRIIVAAIDDGTIRWHRWSDGAELLALFVNRKTKAWVAWTPTGYYMASPGGEDLIGWHLNRGWDQAADFFPASRFRDRFNRPDIVKLVLATLDEAAAIEKANATAHRAEPAKPLIDELPPIIRIEGPGTGTHVTGDAVTIDYAWRSPSGRPVDSIEVFVNGRPVNQVGLPMRARGIGAETRDSVRVQLTGRDNVVGLIAHSRERASQVAFVKILRDDAPAVAKPRKLYALLIGVSTYGEADLGLNYAAKDADDFDAALKAQKGRHYADVETRVLINEKVTRSSVVDGLLWLKRKMREADDVGILFLAGHGMTDQDLTYWFLPADATPDNVLAKGVSQEDLQRFFRKLPGKVLWFLDTCHSGGASGRPPVDVNRLVNAVSDDGGIIAFTSSKGTEVSVESGEWQNGAFTKALLEGIRDGRADYARDGRITLKLLDVFLERRVAELTKEKQHPAMNAPRGTPDFTLAEVPIH